MHGWVSYGRVSWTGDHANMVLPCYISSKYRYVVSLCHAGRVRDQGQFKPPAVDAERRLRKDWGLRACAGIPGSAVSMTSTEAGRQQIAQDECGRDAFPDPASEAPPTGHVMCNMH